MKRVILTLFALLYSVVSHAAPIDLAADGGVITLTTGSMDVALCSPTGCGATKTVNSPSYTNCNKYIFAEPSGTGVRRCYGVPVGTAMTVPNAPVVPPVLTPVPAPTLSMKPAPLNPANTRPYTALTCFPCLDPGFAVVWYYRDANDKWQRYGFSGWTHELPSDFMNTASGLMQRDAGSAFDAAWTAAKVTETQTDPVLKALFEKLVVDTKPADPVPMPPVVAICRITAQSSTVPTRQAYKLTSTGTVSSTAVVRVPAGTSCNASKKIGNYYSVQGQKDVAGVTITLDLYAIGAVVP